MARGQATVDDARADAAGQELPTPHRPTLGVGERRKNRVRVTIEGSTPLSSRSGDVRRIDTAHRGRSFERRLRYR